MNVLDSLDSLENRAETLFDYFSIVRQSVIDKRPQDSGPITDLMMRYIVTASWQKMHRCINDPLSVSILYRLKSVSDEAIQRCFAARWPDHAPWVSSKKDHVLGRCFPIYFKFMINKKYPGLLQVDGKKLRRKSMQRPAGTAGKI